MGTGTITLRDKDTGKTVSFDGYFSGNGKFKNDSSAEGKKNAGPLPRGRYEILYHPQDGFYRLDFIENLRRNDRIDEGVGEGRDKFRLHYPGVSIGCIAGDTKDPKSQNNWQQIVDMLENTKKELVKDNLPSQKYRYSRMLLQVTMPEIPILYDPRPPIIKFGEIEVIDSSRP